MPHSLQEIAAAAIRDIDIREAKRRARRLARVKKPAPKPKTVRPDLPLADAFAAWEHDVVSNPLPVELPAPHKRYLILFTAGFVLLVAVWFGWAWARESVGWRNEAEAQRHAAILLQATVLHGQMETFTRQAQRLEDKARILTEFATDLRNSPTGDDGSLQLRQADVVLAERDRLLNEIDKHRQRLLGLRRELAAVHAP